MTFLDKLKGVKDSVVSGANNVAQKVKDEYEANKQAKEEKRRQKRHIELKC